MSDPKALQQRFQKNHIVEEFKELFKSNEEKKASDNDWEQYISKEDLEKQVKKCMILMCEQMLKNLDVKIKMNIKMQKYFTGDIKKMPLE